MKKTGQLLKDKRESVKLSISEVALATKINPKILAAIENGEESLLPAKTFLKGFLRSYALFLKMDVDEVLRSYQAETGGPPAEKPSEVQKTAQPVTGGRRSMDEENSSGLRTIAVVVIVVLIGVIIGVREIIEKYQREKTVESTPSVKVSPLAQPPIVQETKPAQEVKPVEAPAPAPAPVVAPAPVPIPPPQIVAPAPTPAPVPVPAAVPIQVVKPPPAPVAAASEPAEGSAPDPQVVPQKSKNEIILEALDKVDVKFQIRGELKKLSLAPTQVHTIFSDQPVTFDFSDGGAVNIIVNGRERGTPGDLGKPKQIKIP